MPNPNPSPATRWKKGQSGNPSGPALQDKAVTALKRMGAQELAETCEMILKANRAELAAILEDPNTSMLQVNLISAILADTQKGLTYTLDKLLERVVGKPKERIELSGDPDNPMTMQAVQVLISLPDNGRAEPSTVIFDTPKDKG
jgi:hypothetical protein